MPMKTWKACAVVAVLVAADVAKLGWLEGCWGGVTNGVAMEEQWSSPAGGGLVGMHKDTKGERLVSFEFFRIAPDSSGVPTYFSQPGGRAPATPFRLVELGKERAVFENAEHDFPQRILYWREGAKLHARIEGTVRGEAASEDWVWSRCPSGSPRMRP
jgi:hypothetical protein